jgi:hypothetical protein
MRWRDRSGTKERTAARQGRELTDDCEAFLAGTLAERMERRGDFLPTWVWMNLLAHGSPQQLRACHSSSRRASVTRDWRQARYYLAMEILSAADRHGSLEDLQRCILQPLELAAAAQPVLDHWTTHHWSSWVQAAVDTYCEVHPHPHTPGVDQPA